METLRIGGDEIEYAVKRSPRGKHMRVRVSPGGVVLILPSSRTEVEGRAFLEMNIRWVRSQLAFVRRASGLRKIPKPESGWTIPLQGKGVRVVVERDRPGRGTRIEKTGESITVHTAVSASAETVRRGLVRWLRARAKKMIESRVHSRAREMHVQHGKILIMAQRTKWGNCSALKNLSFNWRLILTPPEVLDYIVVHELAHLLVPAHTAQFWLLVRSYCPRYEQQRDYLKSNAHSLLDVLRPRDT